MWNGNMASSTATTVTLGWDSNGSTSTTPDPYWDELLEVERLNAELKASRLVVFPRRSTSSRQYTRTQDRRPVASERYWMADWLRRRARSPPVG